MPKLREQGGEPGTGLRGAGERAPVQSAGHPRPRRRAQPAAGAAAGRRPAPGVRLLRRRPDGQRDLPRQPRVLLQVRVLWHRAGTVSA